MRLLRPLKGSRNDMTGDEIACPKGRLRAHPQKNRWFAMTEKKKAIPSPPSPPQSRPGFDPDSPFSRIPFSTGLRPVPQNPHRAAT